MGVKFCPILFDLVLSNLDTTGIHKGQAALCPRKSKLFVVFGEHFYEYLQVK